MPVYYSNNQPVKMQFQVIYYDRMLDADEAQEVMANSWEAAVARANRLRVDLDEDYPGRFELRSIALAVVK